MTTLHNSDTQVGRAELDTFCLRVDPGQRVKITAGILQGSEAVVVRQRTAGRVLVRLQRGVYVEVHQFCLEPTKPIRKIKKPGSQR